MALKLPLFSYIKLFFSRFNWCFLTLHFLSSLIDASNTSFSLSIQNRPDCFNSTSPSIFIALHSVAHSKHQTKKLATALNVLKGYLLIRKHWAVISCVFAVENVAVANRLSFVLSSIGGCIALYHVTISSSAGYKCLIKCRPFSLHESF